MKRIEAVIFDWAGTTVDYGCMAPIHAMQAAFSHQQVAVTLDEIRKPMGMLKIDHIKTILEMERVKDHFQLQHGRKYEFHDVEKIYRYFEEMIFSILHQHTTLLPDVLNIQHYLREQQIKMGSTTGYTKAMIDVVAKSAQEQGYSPDHIISADQVPYGRPYPYMLHQNLQALNVQDVRCVIKVGDTIVDIQEGLCAGCWTVGVIKGSSMLGLTEAEVANMQTVELMPKMQFVRYQMLAAGAHFVIESINELPFIIDLIAGRLQH